MPTLLLAGSAEARGRQQHVELTIAVVCGNVCSIGGLVLHVACLAVSSN